MKELCAYVGLILLFVRCSFGVSTVVHPRPPCGWLAPNQVGEFHRSHQLSVSANESSVEDLAAGDGTQDAGYGWVVCVKHGEAKIQNHKTQQETKDGG